MLVLCEVKYLLGLSANKIPFSHFLSMQDTLAQNIR